MTTKSTTAAGTDSVNRITSARVVFDFIDPRVKIESAYDQL